MTIVEALEMRYGQKYLKQIYQNQVKCRYERYNEILQDYGADVERLINREFTQT